MIDTNTYCVILAGGVGRRFWPMSRINRPKQFLDILGTGKTLFRQTYERMAKVVNHQNILVVTLADYVDMVKTQVPELDNSQIITEPYRRDTAPCIALAAHILLKRDPQARMIVAPSDHLILDEAAFFAVIEKGVRFVLQCDDLLTIGIKPFRPETGYGYIQVLPDSPDEPLPEGFGRVKAFTEKPDLEVARIFLESGDFYWNSGIFFWSAGAILTAFGLWAPEMSELFEQFSGQLCTPDHEIALEQLYSRCKVQSIDYAIMEKADNVYMMEAEFGWSDLGTWSALYERLPHDEKENAISGDKIFSFNNSNCLIKVDHDKVAIVEGMNNHVVVLSGDTLLICRKSEEQAIKGFVKDVKIKLGKDWL